MITSAQALERLREGNRRFVAGLGSRNLEQEHSRRLELVVEQAPIAIVLGCSDSRVPAELVFDQGLGDLFVIRVAGNIAAPSQIESIEIAAQQFGTPLVVVLGHSQCSAVTASVDEQMKPVEMRSSSVGVIVKTIQPSVRAVLDSQPGLDRQALVCASIRENVRGTVKRIKAGSDVLEKLLDQGQLHIVGAEYSLETGAVKFMEESS